LLPVGDVTNTTATSRSRRTAALLLACFVPAAVALVAIVTLIAFGSLWPPTSMGTVAWFADEPDLEVLAALVAGGPVAALGGSLLGVAVARWAPFRGSALLGVSVLVVGCAFMDGMPDPWPAVAPWMNLSGSLVVDGEWRSSWLREGVAPGWWCLYTLALSGLAAVAALLKDAPDRRRLLGVAALLAVLAVGSLLLAVG
jgi:hypothetical protein